MQFNIINKPIAEISSDILVLPMFQNSSLDKQAKVIDKNLNKELQNLLKLGDFKGKSEESLIFYTQGKIKAKRVLLAGLGEIKEFDLEQLKSSIANAIRTIDKLGVKNISIAVEDLDTRKHSLKEITQAIAESVLLTAYRFELHKKHALKDKNYKAMKLQTIDIIAEKKSNKQITLGIAQAEILAKSQNWCRDLINHPGNYFTPAKFAHEAEKLAKENKFKCTIWGAKELGRENMGAILGVARGSDEEPKFIILDYNPATYKPSTKRPNYPANPANKVVLVGKGVTFDSGGISLKPGEKMEEMKMDMSGGAAVLAAFKALSELKIKKRVIGLIPAVENLPSGKAIKPGDIIQAQSGKTIEVINTDAEGRLILADALSYASKLKPKAVIDLATLTGAIMIALGEGVGKPAGLFSNNTWLLEKVQKAAILSGEKIWPMPGSQGQLTASDWRIYDEELKSEIADIKNVGPRWGGAITAALFLENFAKDVKWAHIDIAGVAWTDKPKSYFPAGATGWGVRTLVELVKMI